MTAIHSRIVRTRQPQSNFAPNPAVTGLAQLWVPQYGNVAGGALPQTNQGAVLKTAAGLICLEAPGGVGYADAPWLGGTSIDYYTTIAVVRRAGNFSSFARNIVTVGNTLIQIHNNNDQFIVVNSGASAVVTPVTTTTDWHAVAFRRRPGTVEGFASKINGSGAVNYTLTTGASSARLWVTSGTMKVGCISTTNDHPNAAIALVFSIVGDLPDTELRRYLGNPWSIFAPGVRKIWVPSAAAAGVSGTTAILPSGVGAMGSGLTKSISPAGLGYMG